MVFDIWTQLDDGWPTIAGDEECETFWLLPYIDPDEIKKVLDECTVEFKADEPMALAYGWEDDPMLPVLEVIDDRALDGHSDVRIYKRYDVRPLPYVVSLPN